MSKSILSEAISDVSQSSMVAGSGRMADSPRASVSTSQDDGEEIWSDARETTEEQEQTRLLDNKRVDGDELDDEDRIRSVSAPGIGVHAGYQDKNTQAIGEKDPGDIVKTTLDQPSSSVGSPVDSESHVVPDSDYTNPPPTQSSSSPELLDSVSQATPRPTQSLDVLHSYTNERASSPTPTHQSSGLDRRNSRRRSTVDGRAANRISGFFSHLMHRRPEREFASSSSTGRIREERESTATPKESSRASSPAPNRSITPPPSLPSPSLDELGLSLTAITAQLTPSHFNTPPTSGTFLKPHYLLLCHSQGLDVLPLVSPPAPQPYALVRRVAFKSVVVMEQRGVLVAIAGRRDGVRVYALEEVKKAVEWRVDVEIRRERERLRREEVKKGISGGVDKVFGELVLKNDSGKYGQPLDTKSPVTPTTKGRRRKSVAASNDDSAVAPAPLPRPPTTQKIKRMRRASVRESEPPPYSSAARPPPLQTQPSAISVSQARSRSGSVTNVLAGSVTRRRNSVIPPVSSHDDDEKGDWEHASSDDEAINLATAGPSGSAALDERTSSMLARPSSASTSHGLTMTEDGTTTVDIPNTHESLRRTSTSTTMQSMNRRNRPPHLELSRASTSAAVSTAMRPPPSPTPTIWTLRQALSALPSDEGHEALETPDLYGDADDDDDEGPDSVSFAQMLRESRLPDLPPPGTRRAQEPIMISPTTAERPGTPAESENHTNHTPTPSISRSSRRRWSVLDGVFTSSSNNAEHLQSQSRSDLANVNDSSSSITGMRSNEALSTVQRQSSTRRPSTAQGSVRAGDRRVTSPPPPLPRGNLPAAPAHHRFLPRIITNAFQLKRSDENTAHVKISSLELSKRPSGSTLAPIPPAPKLEYIKLPGTKSAIMVKAVETAKKSFLAILCGEGGDKVELFAGTYRTSLGLSRTFLLPDPPRSFELQLQGDDLVEIFLIFAQSVFGLEPATVRVREVRIGRAERRAARRRARETRIDFGGAEAEGPSLGDEESSMNVRVGVTLTTSATAASQGLDDGPNTPPIISRQVSESNLTPSEFPRPVTPNGPNTELASLSVAQLAPYTTFQQLSFAPNFPLATIADDYVVPPTYLSFLEYRAEHEPEADGNSLDLANIQFTPPGLPVPPALPPSKWYYRDPKGTIQGPWKASLMQSWYKDGLLPPDLPVKREEDLDYVLLKDLRAQSVDPSHPFRSPPPPLHSTILSHSEPAKPLLNPISLLTQARYYGPPALFFTTRGGHSTSIVDARGRSVLKGRLQWSVDEDVYAPYGCKLGDVTRLEAFDALNKSVIVAIRQGGLEVADVGDALMKPGDLSRSTLPNYNPFSASFKRRNPFVWRIGSPLSPYAAGPVSSVSLTSTAIPQTPSKKASLPPGKSPAKSDFGGLSNHDDVDGRLNEQLLFLGRHDENVYCCERTNTSFRILRLCPAPS